MEETHTLKGLATLNFFAADHDTAKRWYTELLGFPFYYERPGYMEFRIGEVAQPDHWKVKLIKTYKHSNLVFS